MADVHGESVEQSDDKFESAKDTEADILKRQAYYGQDGILNTLDCLLAQPERIVGVVVGDDELADTESAVLYRPQDTANEVVRLALPWVLAQRAQKAHRDYLARLAHQTIAALQANRSGLAVSQDS